MKKTLLDMQTNDPDRYFTMLRDGFDIILDGYDMTDFENKLLELAKTDSQILDLIADTVEEWEKENPTPRQIRDWADEKAEQKRNYLNDIKL